MNLSHPTTNLTAMATTVGLKTDAFKACLQDKSMDADIDADIRQGIARNVGSTPTFFINEFRLVGGNQLKANGARIIEAILHDKKSD